MTRSGSVVGQVCTRRLGATLLAAAIMVGLGSGGASGVAHSATRERSGVAWFSVGERTAGRRRNRLVPSAFAAADLLVALVAADGPDSVPIGAATTETTARFSDPAGCCGRACACVRPSRLRLPGPAPENFRRICCRGLDGDHHHRVGPGLGPDPGRRTTIPTSRDDGFVVTIAAFTNGRLAEAATIDGMTDDTEQISLSVPDGSAIYAASFAGHLNTDLVPLAGFHLVRQRRAGDDTGGVIASNARALSAGVQHLGYTAPDPGNFWELAVAVVSPAS